MKTHAKAYADGRACDTRCMFRREQKKKIS